MNDAVSNIISITSSPPVSPIIPTSVESLKVMNTLEESFIKKNNRSSNHSFSDDGDDDDDDDETDVDEEEDIHIVKSVSPNQTQSVPISPIHPKSILSIMNDEIIGPFVEPTTPPLSPSKKVQFNNGLNPMNSISVPSFTNPKDIYDVSITDATCTCPNYLHRKVICTHMNYIVENDMVYSEELRNTLVNSIKKNFH
jgi:hypothetical protein